MMTAGHAAVHHAGYGMTCAMAAIHAVRVLRGRLIVMMLFDGALTRSAAGRAIRHPGRGGTWGIKKKNSDQTDQR